jgi:TetR/AcrR family transcriptional repressor of nem operon
MRKGEATRRAIVERAAPLFNQRGYEGCSMADIMEATGLEKGGIYRHFASKEELAREALKYAMAASFRLSVPQPEAGESPLAALRCRIANFVDAPAGMPGGCPLMNTAIDADDGNESLRTIAREGFAAWRDRVVKLVLAAQQALEIDVAADAVWLADTVISTLEGSLMLSRLEGSKQPLLHAQRSLEILLDAVRVKDTTVLA